MKIAELRIGNWVNTKFYKDFKIVGLTIFEDKTAQCSIYKDLNYYPQSTKIEDLRGIKLTDEWLVKLGFGKLEDCHIKKLGKEDLCTYELWLIDPCNDAGYPVQFYEVFDKDDYRFVSLYKPVKYVHQLQNLYFMLCGKELLLV